MPIGQRLEIPNLRSPSNGDQTPQRLQNFFCKSSGDRSVCDRLQSLNASDLRSRLLVNCVVLFEPLNRLKKKNPMFFDHFFHVVAIGVGRFACFFPFCKYFFQTHRCFSSSRSPHSSSSRPPPRVPPSLESQIGLKSLRFEIASKNL